MSDSKIQKGRKSSKKDNLASNLEHRKHVPYGSIKGSHIHTDDGIVNEVNKKQERQNAKKEIRKELDGED